MSKRRVPLIAVGAVLMSVLALTACTTQARPQGEANVPFRVGEYTGIVTRVTDGDTVWVALPAGSRPVKLRIEGIDAPERCQAWGTQATEALKQRLLQRAVTAKLHAIDRYGRRVGTLYDATGDVGQRMVAEGNAWSIRLRGQTGPYLQEERMAMSSKRGLHAEGHAVLPHVFRRQHGPCQNP